MNMKNLADYIMIVDDVLPADLCASLIEKFDSANDLVVRDSSWTHDYKSFKELNLTSHNDFSEEQKMFYRISQAMLKFYVEKTNAEFFPEKIGMEEVRMKRYDPNQKDQFGWHTDVGDYASARRFLVMFYYLNDVEEGGETVFRDKIGSLKELKVQPKRGRMVMFPPMWMYPHKGMQPISNSKYIVSTYLHYL